MKETLEKLETEIKGIKDEKTREVILSLFNIIEEQAKTNKKLQEENQKLRDEIALLKGEKQKPNIKGKNQKGNDQETNSTNISSENERKTPKKHEKKAKKHKIRIDRTIKCTVDKNLLPKDAEWKGYESVIIQDISISTNNVEYLKERYYSPSLNKTFSGTLPVEYGGGFGPEIRAFTLILKHVCQMTEPKILEFYQNMGVDISKGTITSMLIKKKELFHQEKTDIFLAGIKSSPYTQTDDTGARVNGENQHTHIMSSPLFTAYFTREKKDRLTILDLLRNSHEAKRKYCFNEEAFELLDKMRINQKIQTKLRNIEKGRLYNTEALEKMLADHIPKAGKTQITRIKEATGIAAYHQEIETVVKILICDDAPQFKHLTKELGGCWVHDGRHYKKLTPIISYHQQLLSDFLTKYWQFYHRLLDYKHNPSSEFGEKLSHEFDGLFMTKTGYHDLDNRIEKTRDKKYELLLVLKYPEIPLHNNDPELAARAMVRKRDISFQTRTKEGTEASDTFMTIIETAKKLGVNVYLYLQDRISNAFSLPSLSDLILSSKIP